MHKRRFALCTVLLWAFSPPMRPWAAEPQIRWDPARGVVLQSRAITILFGGGQTSNATLLRFGNVMPQAAQTPLTTRSTPTTLQLTYRLQAPGDVELTIKRDIQARPENDGIVFLEKLSLTPSSPLTTDLELEIPYSFQAATDSARTRGKGRVGNCLAVSPLKNGWAKPQSLAAAELRCEYRLGAVLTAQDTPELALPLVHLVGGDWQGALLADPEFSCLFSARQKDGAVEGSLRFRYAGSQVPLKTTEVRTFAIWLPNAHPSGASSQGRALASPKAVRTVLRDGSLTLPSREFERSVDAFFRLLLPDVAPGPPWLHQIAMVGYDFLSDDGQGWERDIRLLANWLKPAQRRRVALCLHGWYDALGSYSYDATSHAMKEEWVAFARTRKVHFTQAELKRRLRLARDLGFRVLLYFGDGLAADSGVPGYHDGWAYRDRAGNKIAGWQGPDTFGATYLLNPAHPEVAAWYAGYLRALLRTYGTEIDGVVWDETFHARTGQIAFQPEPAYCDRAMFNLVKNLAQQVHEFDREKVFLASDCIGAVGQDVPGYGMVAHGTYQDSHCEPKAWSYGLFPNWRNSFWSCNWDDVTGFHYTRWGVQNFGVPVAISNGWGDDLGPSEWQPSQREAVLRLFQERLRQSSPVRFLRDDPAKLLVTAPDQALGGDPIPEPVPGEVNWASSGLGGQASASSYERTTAGSWQPEGAIDGRRDEAGWGRQHGWASKHGEALPQTIEVRFAQQRKITRFVVVNYQKEGTGETAAKWGGRGAFRRLKYGRAAPMAHIRPNEVIGLWITLSIYCTGLFTLSNPEHT